MHVRKRSVLVALAVILVLAVILYLAAAAGPTPPTCGVCGGTTPVCDPTTGACVACTADAQCASGTLCSPASGACVACYGDAAGCPTGQYCLGGTQCVACRPGHNSDCDGSSDGSICGASNTCVRCRDNTDCSNKALPGYDATKPYCDTAANACVGCLGNDECTAGLDHYCDGGLCVACDPGDPAGSFCDPGYCTAPGGVPTCVPCVAGSSTLACKDGTYCVASGDSSTCVECVDGDPDYACPSGHTCQGGQCRQACAVNADCAGGSTPNCIDGACVACSTNVDCLDDVFPVCASGLCVECNVAQGETDGCADPEAPVCYMNSCQQCSPANGSADCTSPNKSFCQKVSPAGASDSYQCVQCTNDGYCRGLNVGRDHCGADFTCVECAGDGDCGDESCIGGVCVTCGDGGPACPDGTYCSGGKCIECETDAGCAHSGGDGLCGQDGRCVHCKTDANCPGPGDGAGLAHCRPDGQACVACTSDLNCTANPRRLCDNGPGGSYTCVQCDAAVPCASVEAPNCDNGVCVSCGGDYGAADPYACPQGAPFCDGGRCVECRTGYGRDCSDTKNPNGRVCWNNKCVQCTQNGDCADTEYCADNKCAALPSPCWSWKKWYVAGPNARGAPDDAAMGSADWVAVVGRNTTSDKWVFGEAPRTASVPYSPGYGSMWGNRQGDSGKNYQQTVTPTEWYFWYLAAKPNCSRYPGQFWSGATAIRFHEDHPEDITVGQQVCALRTGERTFSGPTDSGACEYPSGMGTFYLMSAAGHNDVADIYW